MLASRSSLGQSMQYEEPWQTYCLIILEQPCVVWENLLTEDNKLDLERTQKSFCKLV